MGRRSLGEALTRVYRKGSLEAEGFPISELSEYLEEPDTVVWADLCRPTKEQLDELAAELNLHELAVEDAVGRQQRPKLDRYESHLFLTAYAVGVDLERGRLEEIEVDAFLTDRYLITVRKNEGFAIEPVVARWDRSPDLAMHGTSFLLYGLLDVMVDGYFDAIESFDEYYERVSEGLFQDQPLDPSKQRLWFDMRRAMVRFHKLVVPTREAISSLMRREQSVIAQGIYPYFQDVYDHILRVSESTDSLRDLVSTIVETNLSLRDYRQNLIVKKVSSWAAIVAIPALVTGYYGMNVPYPGSGKPLGVVAATVIMVLASLGLYAIFRRRDWL
jgi:magnesium transporter